MNALIVFALVGLVFGLVHYGAVSAHNQQADRALVALAFAAIVLMAIAVYRPITIEMLVDGAGMYLLGLILITGIWSLRYRVRMAKKEK
jgi:predicted membrane channel-forming protein YqfA (hemolysin III family)